MLPDFKLEQKLAQIRRDEIRKETRMKSLKSLDTSYANPTGNIKNSKYFHGERNSSEKRPYFFDKN